MLSLISQSVPSQKPQCLGLTKVCFFSPLERVKPASLSGPLHETSSSRVVGSSQISQCGETRCQPPEDLLFAPPFLLRVGSPSDHPLYSKTPHHHGDQLLLLPVLLSFFHFWL